MVVLLRTRQGCSLRRGGTLPIKQVKTCQFKKLKIKLQKLKLVFDSVFVFYMNVKKYPLAKEIETWNFSRKTRAALASGCATGPMFGPGQDAR